MSYFWHNPRISAAFDKGGTDWHVYGPKGTTLCGKYALIGRGRPDDARGRMPSRATADVCSICEKKRPAQIHFKHGGDPR